LEPAPDFVVGRQGVEVLRQSQDGHDPKKKGPQGETRIPRLNLVERTASDASALRDDRRAQPAPTASKSKSLA
jgi:hypothetical protein